MIEPEPKMLKIPNQCFLALDDMVFQPFFQGSKKAFNLAVLPGAVLFALLVLDIQKPQPESEQPGGEDWFIVGSKTVGLAEPFDDVQYLSQKRDRRFGSERL